MSLGAGCFVPLGTQASGRGRGTTGAEEEDYGCFSFHKHLQTRRFLHGTTVRVLLLVQSALEDLRQAGGTTPDGAPSPFQPWSPLHLPPPTREALGARVKAGQALPQHLKALCGTPFPSKTPLLGVLCPALPAQFSE